MTRLEALEAVAAAARVLVAPLNRDNCCSHCGWTGAHLQHCPVVALRDALAALDRSEEVGGGGAASGTPEVMYAVRRKDGDPICGDFIFVVVPDPHDWVPAEDDAEYRLDAGTYEMVRMTVEIVARRTLPECSEGGCTVPAVFWGLCERHAREDDPDYFDRLEASTHDEVEG